MREQRGTRWWWGGEGAGGGEKSERGPAMDSGEGARGEEGGE